MLSDGQICEAIDAPRGDDKQPTLEAIADQLVVDDIEGLNARLIQAAKDGVVWMVAAWWQRREDDTADPLHFAYYVRRGDSDTDLG